MEVAQPQAEYLVTLQPTKASALAEFMDSRRASSRLIHGPDETSLYPLHASVTGFFKATEEQAQDVCKALPELIALAPAEGLRVEVYGALTIDDGCVILNVAAPGIKEVAESLSSLVKSGGVLVRPKRVRHMSLAKGRSQEERMQIAHLYREVPLGHCPFDLVVSRLLQRSDLKQLFSSGQTHHFEDMLRVRLPEPEGVVPDVVPVPAPAPAPVMAPPGDASLESNCRPSPRLYSRTAWTLATAALEMAA